MRSRRWWAVDLELALRVQVYITVNRCARNFLPQSCIVCLPSNGRAHEQSRIVLWLMSGLLAIPDIMEPDLGSPETTDGDGGHRDRWQIQVKHYTRPTHSLAANLNAAANIYAAAPRRRTLGNATERHTNRTERPGGTTPRARPASAMPSLSTDSATELQRTCVRLTGLTGGTGLSDRSDLSRRPRTSSAARPISAGGQYELEAMLRRPMSAVRPMPPRPSTASRQRGGLADPLALFGYETLGPIASGSFSQVVRARQTDSGREVAVKS